ncbi:hypothetical protein JTB14_019659 [Gonioctena quinquepunctata]|nr:hypothetical protein JTB14_019659 [Gonioctena quinquepunctata]
MKSILLLGTILTTAMAQRPSFAGTRPIGVPELATRFKNNDTSASPASGADPDLANRFGSNNSSGNGMNIPVDARGDENLVKRLQSWPRENQPFWLINADAIEAQRNPTQRTGSGQQVVQQTVGNRNQDVVVTETRGSVGPGHLSENRSVQNYFTVYVNNQLKTYVYDPERDAWFPRRV